MASFTKHGDGWRAHIARHGQRATKVFKTKREAQAWAIRKEADFDGLKGSGGKTFAAAAEHYLETVSPCKRGAPVEWERRRFAAAVEFFGESAALAQIDSERIGQWRDKRLQTVSGSTVMRESNLIRHLFTLACDEWQWIDRNPFKGVRLPKENAPRHQLWQWQQIKRVIRAGQRAGGKTAEVAAAFHIALRTGMRLAEVLAAPAAFDPRRRVVTIKTKTSARDEVPIGRIGAKLLARANFTVGANEASALFSRLTRQQMIEGLTFHDARASALTWLARKVDVMTLARVSRHRDISLLHRVYYRESSADISKRL